MTLNPDHPDFNDLLPIRQEIEQRLAGEDGIRSTFPAVVASAVDYVVDAVRTGRTFIS